MKDKDVGKLREDLAMCQRALSSENDILRLVIEQI